MTKKNRNKDKRKNTAREKTVKPAYDILALCENLIFFLLCAAMFIIPLFFNILTYDQFELPKLTVLRVLTSLMLGLWAIKIIARGRLEYKPTPLDFPLLLWVIMNIITTFTSFAPHLSFRGEYENFAGSLSNINYVILYFIAAQNLKTKKQIFILNGTLLSAGLLITIYSLAQYFGNDFIRWSAGSMIKGRYFSTMGNPNFLGALLIMIIPLNITFFMSAAGKMKHLKIFSSLKPLGITAGYTAATALFISFLVSNMSPGNTTHTLLSALFFVVLFLGLTIAGYLLLKSNRPEGAGKIQVASSLFSGMLILLFIFLFISLLGTQSRGPVIGFIASMLFMIYMFIKERPAKTGGGIRSILKTFFSNKKAVSAALIIASVIVLLSATFGKAGLNRFITSAASPVDSFMRSRGYIWGPALEIIKGHPLIGTGVDTFKSVFPMYESIEFSYIDGANVSSRTAHNELLNTAATMGLISLGIYLLLVWAYFKMWLRSYRRLSGYDIKLLSLAMFTGFVAYFTQNLMSFGVAAINTVLYLFMASHAALYRMTHGSKTRVITLFQKGRGPVFIIQAVLTAAAIAGTAWLVSASASFFTADIHYNRGKIFTMQAGSAKNKKKIKQAKLYAGAAVQEHTKAVEQAPGEVKYHVYLGLAYEKYAMLVSEPAVRKNAVSSSIANYSRGTELNPGNAYYWGNLGRIYTFRAKTENPEYLNEAVKYYKKAIKKAPVTGLFYTNLMDIYIQTGMYEAAGKLFNELKQADKRHAAKTAFSAGTDFFGKKDFQNAKKYFLEAVKLDPNMAKAHYNLGVTFAALNDAAPAKHHLEKFLELSPGSKMAAHAKKILESIVPEK